MSASSPTFVILEGMKLIAFLLTSVTLLPLAAADVSIVDNDQTIAVDCATDPNVSIMGNQATVSLTGTCAKVVISGNHATVSGSAALVSILGNHNTARLDGVDTISVSGNHNTATYKKPVNPKLKKTKVSSLGSHNTITRTK